MALATPLLAKTEGVTVLLLAGIVVTLVYPVLKLRPVQDGRNLHKIGAVLTLLLVVVAYGWYFWPPRAYLDLSSSQKKEFVAVLRELRPTRRVVLRCGAGPTVCASAGEFVELFQNAKWIVAGNKIEMGFAGKPQFGVTLHVHGDGTIPDPDDPKYGLWTKMYNPERDSIIRAFARVGITMGKPTAEANLKESDIAIIFGPERPQP